jgi:hypothetical protein
VKGGSGLVRLAATASAAAAVVALVVAGLAGSWAAGLALALGLVLGGLNAALVARSLGAGSGFRATSLGRLALLSLVGLGIGFAAFPAAAWLVPIGLGAAQLILVALSARELARA